VMARLVLETIVFWAVHRHWDPSPQSTNESSTRQTVVKFLAAGIAAEPRR
jgi:hypothetical protein